MRVGEFDNQPWLCRHHRPRLLDLVAVVAVVAVVAAVAVLGIAGNEIEIG